MVRQLETTTKKTLGMHNLNPRIWGPALWLVLHSISFAYPENPTQEHRYAHRMFLKNMAGVLPCARCRGHFREFLNRAESPGAPKGSLLEAALRSKKRLIAWTLELHNAVNKRNNASEINEERLFEKYGDLYAPEKVHVHGQRCSNAYKLLLGIADCPDVTSVEASSDLDTKPEKCDCTVDDSEDSKDSEDSENGLTPDKAESFRDFFRSKGKYKETFSSDFKFSDLLTWSFWKSLFYFVFVSVRDIFFSRPVKMIVLLLVSMGFFLAVISVLDFST